MDVIHTKNCIIKLIAVILISLMIHIGLQINKIIKSITASEYRCRKFVNQILIFSLVEHLEMLYSSIF